jgi:hypothetical protein
MCRRYLKPAFYYSNYTNLEERLARHSDQG